MVTKSKHVAITVVSFETDTPFAGRRALAIYEQRLGADHPNTQNVQANYTALLRQIEADGAQP